MTLPLYGHTLDQPAAAVTGGNAGLYWAKFFDRWKADWSGVPKPDEDEGKGGKQRWLERFGGRQIGDKREIREHAKRRRLLVAAQPGRWQAELALGSRFVTGTGLAHPVENGMLFHHTLGTPYLPGSGVKGLVRAWAEQVEAIPEADRELVRILGPRAERPDAGVGSVVFLDALPTEPVELLVEVMTPHYAPWYRDGGPPADWHSPSSIPFLAVKEGQTFAFALLPRVGRGVDAAQAATDVQTVKGWLLEALGWLGAGAKTAVGFGRFGAAQATARGGQGRPPEAPAVSRLFVDDEPVTVLKRHAGDALVRFTGGDTEWVAEDSIERR